MKSLVMNDMKLAVISDQEMIDIEGGILPLLIIGACILLAGCVQNNQNNSSSQINVRIVGQNVGDSINNKNNGTLKVTPKP